MGHGLEVVGDVLGHAGATFGVWGCVGTAVGRFGEVKEVIQTHIVRYFLLWAGSRDLRHTMRTTMRRSWSSTTKTRSTRFRALSMTFFPVELSAAKSGPSLI